MSGRRWGVPRPGGFFWKLYGTYVAVVLVSSLVLAFLVFEFFAANARANLRSKTGQLAELLAALEAANPMELWTPIAQNRVEELARSSEADIDIVLADGEVVASSRRASALGAGLLDLPEFAMAVSTGEGELFRKGREDRFETLHVVRSISIRSESIGYVRASVSLRVLTDEFQRLGSKIAMGGVVAAGLSLVGGIVFARTVTRPLELIEQGCLRIVNGDRSQPIALNRADEFGVVAKTVNAMAQSLTCQMRRLEQQKRRSELVLSLLNEAVIAIDGSGRIAFMNKAASLYCRCGSVNSCMGLAHTEAIVVPGLLDLVSRYGSCGCEKELELHWTDPSGERRFGSVYIAPLDAEEHELLGTLVVVRDTTERKRFDLLRRDFASNVSHELKTPITAIATLIEALNDGAAADAELRESFLERIGLQNQRMKRLVDELLAISKLESGESVLQLRRCDLREVFRAARETFQPVALFRGLQLKVAEPDGPVWVMGDLRGLEVMLNSLIDNAIKYTGKVGRIDVDCVVDKEDARIRVTDTGCGIAKEHQVRVFERFYRADASRARERGGSGLGLAIVKHMAHAHHGEVKLESEEGEGCRFTVSLPLA